MGLSHRLGPCALLILGACGPGPSTTGTDASDSGGSAAQTSGISATTAPATATTIATATATTEGSSTTSSGSSGPPSTSDTTAGACDPTAMVPCGGAVYQCGNGIDDDGDGLVDLQDPECVTPCDDDEFTFTHGIPGVNIGCTRDCYFDGNSGHGDDGCRWNIRCDPLSPGDEFGCEYEPGVCPPPPGDPEQCAAFCPPRALNGCDCFGCCTFEVDGQPVDLYLDSHECSVDQLDNCAPCTSQLETCGNPCEPEACEICVGQTEPPAGCDEPGCVGGTACETICDCGPAEYCAGGCCHPMPP